MRTVILVVLTSLIFGTQIASADRWHDHHAGRAQHQEGGGSSPAPMTAGAIAYSATTGMTGWAYGYPDEASARVAAEQSCGQADCRWQVSEIGESAAFVATPAGFTYVAWDRTLADAQRAALQLCSASQTGCYVQSSVTN